MSDQVSLGSLISGGVALVVDDDENARQEVADIFERHGIATVMQESASHAVRYLQNQPWNWRPGIIITDLVMDGMGGYQFIRRVLELYPKSQIPIVVISKLDAGVDVGEAEIAGAHGYITKPVDENRLVKLLERINSKDGKGMVLFHNEIVQRSFR